MFPNIPLKKCMIWYVPFLAQNPTNTAMMGEALKLNLHYAAARHADEVLKEAPCQVLAGSHHTLW